MNGKTYRNLLDQVPVYDSIPEGWKEIWGAQTAPSGYVWIYNRKSILSKEYRHGLLKLQESCLKK